MAAVVAVGYHEKVKGELAAERSRYADLFTKLLVSEELRIKAQQELDFLKQTVLQIMQRPVQAVLEDQQVAMITQALNEYWTNVYHKN